LGFPLTLLDQEIARGLRTFFTPYNKGLPEEFDSPILYQAKPVTDPKQSLTKTKIAKCNSELRPFEKIHKRLKCGLEIVVVSLISIDTYEIQRYSRISPGHFLNDLVNSLRTSLFTAPLGVE
jgi:hypothetical protein